MVYLWYISYRGKWVGKKKRLRWFLKRVIPKKKKKRLRSTVVSALIRTGSCRSSEQASCPSVEDPESFSGEMTGTWDLKTEQELDQERWFRWRQEERGHQEGGHKSQLTAFKEMYVARLERTRLEWAKGGEVVRGEVTKKRSGHVKGWEF